MDLSECGSTLFRDGAVAPLATLRLCVSVRPNRPWRPPPRLHVSASRWPPLMRRVDAWLHTSNRSAALTTLRLDLCGCTPPPTFAVSVASRLVGSCFGTALRAVTLDFGGWGLGDNGLRCLAHRVGVVAARRRRAGARTLDRLRLGLAHNGVRDPGAAAGVLLEALLPCVADHVVLGIGDGDDHGQDDAPVAVWSSVTAPPSVVLLLSSAMRHTMRRHPLCACRTLEKHPLPWTLW